MKSKIKPWSKGPYELINHAQGHLESGKDIDRLIALIGFDNAIEISIETFINLHPDMRDGFKIPREKAERALRNFHTKIQFFEQYLQLKNIPFEIPISTIKWFHQQRNFLYHTGSGLVPELDVVKGAYIAAIAVFTALFKTDIPTPFNKTSVGDVIKQGSEANAIREIIKQIGPYLIWQGKQNRNNFYLIAKLPDGRFGLQIIVKRDDSSIEKTAFIKGDGSLDTTINFLKKLANPYSGPSLIKKLETK